MTAVAILPANKVKRAVRKRDRYRCTECGMTSQEHLELYDRLLEVHRINPGSVYTVKGCVTLCRDCHYLKPKSARGSAAFVVRYGANLTVWIDPDLKKQLVELVRTHKPKTTLTGIVEVALARYFAELKSEK